MHKTGHKEGRVCSTFLYEEKHSRKTSTAPTADFKTHHVLVVIRQPLFVLIPLSVSGKIAREKSLHKQLKKRMERACWWSDESLNKKIFVKQFSTVTSSSKKSNKNIEVRNRKFALPSLQFRSKSHSK